MSKEVSEKQNLREVSSSRTISPTPVRNYVVSLSLTPPDRFLLRSDDLDAYIAHRAMPFRRIGAAISVICSSEDDAQALRRHIPHLPPVIEIVLTSGREIDAALRDIFRDELSRRAKDSLFEHDPTASARNPLSRRAAVISFLAVAGLCVAAVLAPATALAVLAVLMLLYVAATSLLKAFLIFAAVRSDRSAPVESGNRTPDVSILVPLFQEERAVATLTKALERLLYPQERLDVKYLVEEGDTQTWAALDTLDLPEFIEVIPIPYSEPQTKPKAMNFALPFVRGELVGIFDAEDIPDRSQIRKAVDAMDRAAHGTVCVQARLNHFNATDSLVARGASMEYAMWFDVLLTGLSALRLPVPLGGTSLYVKTSALREVGGWDPDNVTEDADLGIRLARRGWRAAVFDSTTLEEAPERCGQWIGQRSRWVKGFIVTWLVQMRQPRRLVGDLGWFSAAAICLMLFDGFVAFLMQPLFLLALVLGLAAWFWPMLMLPDAIFLSSLIVFPLGQALVLGAAGLAVAGRFGWRRVLWVPWLWVYWQMGMVAAFRAVWELLVSPNSWVKTEHGVGRNVQARRDYALRDH